MRDKEGACVAHHRESSRSVDVGVRFHLLRVHLTIYSSYSSETLLAYHTNCCVIHDTISKEAYFHEYSYHPPWQLLLLSSLTPEPS